MSPGNNAQELYSCSSIESSTFQSATDDSYSYGEGEDYSTTSESCQKETSSSSSQSFRGPNAVPTSTPRAIYPTYHYPPPSYAINYGYPPPMPYNYMPFNGYPQCGQPVAQIYGGPHISTQSVHGSNQSMCLGGSFGSATSAPQSNGESSSGNELTEEQKRDAEFIIGHKRKRRSAGNSDEYQKKSKFCMRDGCKKYAQGGTRYCVAHGGGKRCQVDGCSTGARGASKFCILHGGGKRCEKPGCVKSAIGSTSFCIRHGGGRRCQYDGCVKSAQGTLEFCVKHGHVKKCVTKDCQSYARTRSKYCTIHQRQYRVV